MIWIQIYFNLLLKLPSWIVNFIVQPWDVLPDSAEIYFSVNCILLLTIYFSESFLLLVPSFSHRLVAFEGNYRFALRLPNITRLISPVVDVVRRNGLGDVTRWKKTERETGMGREAVSVSCICRDPGALCLDFLISYFLVCCCARDTSPV